MEPFDVIASLERRVEWHSKHGTTDELGKALDVLYRERKRAAEDAYYNGIAEMLNNEQRTKEREAAAMYRAGRTFLQGWRRGPLLARLAWLSVGLTPFVTALAMGAL